MRRLLAILIPGLLLLTACGGSPAAPEPTSQSAGDTAKFDSLKLTDNGDQKAPGVEFSKPLEVTEPTIKVVAEGDGDRVKENQIANISILALSGADGSTLEDTFPGEPEPLQLNEELKTGSPVIYSAFVGSKVGSSLALAIPGQAATAEGAPAQPTQLLLIKVLSTKDAPQTVAPLAKPEGETVTPPAGLPTVKDNDQGVPEISVDGIAAPTALVSQDLIKGNGAEVKETDTLTVNYVGVNLVGGTKFDSSFDRGEPASFPLTGVIPGWTQGLAGKTVGSRVLLVVPKDLAYGDAGQGEAKGDLVFVVDILGVK
ncbi:FKBP-type peptidyl-prolyl cis-trans isomerase [Pseudarthrobacter raffinosi]|uniref:FKBP-type peptidyl-prolyl cis-trans isomerase n=1 Tax=Pseudarthrobacter raffinosi TaxID=2953651 RepID=UPI00208FABF7|nr:MULTISPECIES: FKBP-type peptidyl-prolyl cis-trans isomerase [unclassified Pseudarthrobacter]MCO4236559.1 FKBP-type peptidyl-prolyl cis-trans isomerase [Pseudarthrobacter sp. MDT3-28]MCO4250026.1 FKBP-type peptidyl-prolyl cis-trans isomerase [Pseudarthrobacter sp. MDT3-9]MCO4262482.1 FKBP-type peptidyl-prolyl cis-trans isomerase [Pseudarthrobacter sp. MDT3-26]